MILNQFLSVGPRFPCKSMDPHSAKIPCRECGKTFNTKECYEYHLDLQPGMKNNTCKRVKFCAECQKTNRIDVSYTIENNNLIIILSMGMCVCGKETQIGKRKWVRMEQREWLWFLIKLVDQIRIIVRIFFLKLFLHP